MKNLLVKDLPFPSKEEGDQSMWGRPCRGKSPIF